MKVRFAGTAGLYAVPAQCCRSSGLRGICSASCWHYTCGRKTKNRTDWDLRPIMSCSNTSPVFNRNISFFSPKNPILHLSGRSSDSASTPQTPSQLSPVTFVCSSTSQQRSCRRFSLRSLFTRALHADTCKLPIFCFRKYYSTFVWKCKYGRTEKASKTQIEKLPHLRELLYIERQLYLLRKIDGAMPISFLNTVVK